MDNNNHHHHHSSIESKINQGSKRVGISSQSDNRCFVSCFTKNHYYQEKGYSRLIYLRKKTNKQYSRCDSFTQETYIQPWKGKSHPTHSLLLEYHLSIHPPTSPHLHTSLINYKTQKQKWNMGENKLSVNQSKQTNKQTKAIDGFYTDGSSQSSVSTITSSDKKEKEKKLGDVWEQYKGELGNGKKKKKKKKKGLGKGKGKARMFLFLDSRWKNGADWLIWLIDWLIGLDWVFWDGNKDPNNPGLITIEGTLQLCEDLEIDPESVSISSSSWTSPSLPLSLSLSLSLSFSLSLSLLARINHAIV